MDLEKKLVGAYRDMVNTASSPLKCFPSHEDLQTTVEVPSEEGMFEDGEDADHFASYV